MPSEWGVYGENLLSEISVEQVKGWGSMPLQ